MPRVHILYIYIYIHLYSFACLYLYYTHIYICCIHFIGSKIDRLDLVFPRLKKTPSNIMMEQTDPAPLMQTLATDNGSFSVWVEWCWCVHLKDMDWFFESSRLTNAQSLVSSSGSQVKMGSSSRCGAYPKLEDWFFASLSWVFHRGYLNFRKPSDDW